MFCMFVNTEQWGSLNQSEKLFVSKVFKPSTMRFEPFLKQQCGWYEEDIVLTSINAKFNWPEFGMSSHSSTQYPWLLRQLWSSWWWIKLTSNLPMLRTQDSEPVILIYWPSMFAVIIHLQTLCLSIRDDLTEISIEYAWHIWITYALDVSMTFNVHVLRCFLVF